MVRRRLKNSLFHHWDHANHQFHAHPDLPATPSDPGYLVLQVGLDPPGERARGMERVDRGREGRREIEGEREGER